MRGDEREWRRIDRDEVADGWSEITPVAFALAARRRFGLQGDRRMVTRFVQAFIERTPGTEGIAHRDAEAVIRGVLGEDWLVSTVDATRGGPIMYAALFALVDDLELSDDQADALLAEAEATVAAAYRSVETPPPGPDEAPALTFDMHRRTRRRLLSTERQLPDRPAALRAPRGFQTGNKNARRLLEAKRRMQPSTMAGRHLRGVLLRDEQEETRFKDTPDDEVLRVLRAAFETALPIYLHPDPDVREIAALVKLTRDVFYQDLDMMKAEFLARTALGEDVPLDGVTRKDLYMHWTLMLYTVTDWWHRDRAALDAIIASAEQAVAASGYRLTASTA
jgi:hypothetical protein